MRWRSDIASVHSSIAVYPLENNRVLSARDDVDGSCSKILVAPSVIDGTSLRYDR